MSFQLIDAEKTVIPIETACSVLDVSTSGYYAWKNRKASLRQQRDMLLLAHVCAQFSNFNGTYGSRRMHVELKEEGLEVGLHRVARTMQENGFKARQKTRYKKNDRQRSWWSSGAQSARSKFYGRRSQREMGCRYLVRVDGRRLALSGDHARPVLAQNCWLGDLG